MGESVGAYDRLVRRNRDSQQLRNHQARPAEFARVDIGPKIEVVRSRADRHDGLFERRVARPLADSVYRGLHLPRAVLKARKRVRHRQAEVIMAMYADGHAAGIAYFGADIAD